MIETLSGIVITFIILFIIFIILVDWWLSTILDGIRQLYRLIKDIREEYNNDHNQYDE